MADDFDEAAGTAGQPDRGPEADARTGRAAAAARMQRKAEYVDLQLQQAMARGDFDDLPGAGKPIKGLDRPDKDWWLRQLVEREQLTGLLPPALALRNEDADLDDTLDRESTEKRVRELVEDFNRRVVDARRQLVGGPPVITAIRDVDAEVRRWRDRRAALLAARRALLDVEQGERPTSGEGQTSAADSQAGKRKRRWLRRSRQD